MNRHSSGQAKPNADQEVRMDEGQRKPVMLSRPKDESLEAYKAFISEIFKHLTGRDISEAPDAPTEEKWQSSWRKFWSKKNEEESKP